MLLEMLGIFINISYKFLTNCKTKTKKKILENYENSDKNYFSYCHFNYNI